MDGMAIVLVLSAAFFHAFWNFLVKKAGGGPVFIWLFASFSVVFYAPLCAYLLWMKRFRFSPAALTFIVVSALLHLMYFLILQQGYKKGDLSLVYPLARGTGPLLSVFAAIVFFGERPGWVAGTGAALIVFSVFYFAGGLRLFERRETGVSWSLGYGILTGMVIAAYTIWDKQAVSAVLIPPIILDWSSSIVRMLVLGPYAARRWDAVKRQWKMNKKYILGVAIFNPLSYILVLTALIFTPVSYIAPAREISILFGTVLGTHFLAEGHFKERIVSAGLMILGMIALSMG